MTINDYLKDYLDKMMEFREAAGYATATYKITLMPFIDFCCSNYKDASVLTSDMLDEWLDKREIIFEKLPPNAWMNG